MFDDIRAPRGPVFRPRSSCCLRGPPRRTIHFSSSSALGSDLLARIHKNTESKSSDKHDTDTRPYTGHLTHIQMQMHEDS